MLPDGARGLLDAMAVLGREAEGPIIERVGELADPARLEAQSVLLQLSLIEEDRSRLRFTHDKFREVIYAGLAEECRRAFHRRAAEVLAEVRGDDPEFQGEVGLHWEAAGWIDRARPCYLAAAEHAGRVHAGELAESSFRAYLRVTPASSAERCRVRREFASQVLLPAGRPGEVEEQLRAAIEEAVHLGLPGEEGWGRLQLGLLYERTSRGEAAMAEYDRLEEIARSEGDRRLEVAGMIRRAEYHRDRGVASDSLACFEAARAIAVAIEDRNHEAHALSGLAREHARSGRAEPARVLLERVLEIHRELGNRHSEAVALSNLADLRSAQGLGEDEERLRQALAIKP